MQNLQNSDDAITADITTKTGIDNQLQSDIQTLLEQKANAFVQNHMQPNNNPYVFTQLTQNLLTPQNLTQQLVTNGINELVTAYRAAIAAGDQPALANISNIALLSKNKTPNLIFGLNANLKTFLGKITTGVRLGGADPPVDSSRNLTSFNQAIIVGAITMILVLIWSLFGGSKTATGYDQSDYDQLDYNQLDEYEYYNHGNYDGDGSYYYDDDSTDYNGYYNAETYGDSTGQYDSEYDEKNNEYASNNYKNIDLDFIKYDQYGHGYAYYADLY